MKKLNQRIADRSRRARINRQLVEDDERNELGEIVCGRIRPLHPVPRFATVEVVETGPGHRTRIHEVELAC